MTGPVPIPDYGYRSLPAPVWLLVALSTITFWLHLISVGCVVGSMVVLFFRRVARIFQGMPGELDRQLDARIIKTLPVFFSLTITFGVAPLLLTQALYGHYFYCANIFIGHFWILSLAFLLAAFVGESQARNRYTQLASKTTGPGN